MDVVQQIGKILQMAQYFGDGAVRSQIRSLKPVIYSMSTTVKPVGEYHEPD